MAPTAVGKALAVLAAFSRRRPALGLVELADMTGLALSTVHRVVAELVRWGALERGADGRYRIGLRVWEVGTLAPRGVALREAALPFMEDLYEVTHENVQLAVREGTELVFVERFAGHTSVPVLTAVGGRFALSPTGVGLVLLAYAPVDVQEAVLAHPPKKLTARTMTAAGDLRRALAEVRRAGVAISDRQVTMDAVSIAAPVWDSDDRVIAALSVVVRGEGPAAVKPLGPAVRAAALGISRALGPATRSSTGRSKDRG